MRPRDKKKLGHEEAVADELLCELKIESSDARPGNPDKQEPDRLYRIGDKTIGIEVVTAYYTQGEAMITAEAAAEKPIAPDEIREGEMIVSPDDAICDVIQDCLNQKSAKTYSGTDETWLCISADATLTESAIIEACVNNLEVPDHHFSRMFVTLRKSENEGGGLALFEVESGKS
jgi:hypothetical protein